MKVLLADKLDPIVRNYLKEHNHEIIEDASLKEDSLKDALERSKPDVLVVRSTKVNTDHILSNPNLNLIIRAGAGVNTIDLQSASQRGIFVTNCPGRNAVAVAELVMGHILNWDRHLYENISDFRQGIWNKKAHGQAKGLMGQTLAIFGVGAIGKAVIKRAKSFGIHIKAWSRSLTEEQAKKLGVEFCSTPLEAASGSDIISVHLPSIAATKNFFNASIFNAMNTGGLVINTSRNSLLHEQDLLAAIESKGLKAGLDVFDNEPAGSTGAIESILQDNPNVYVTHHIGASTDEATLSVAQAVIDIIDTYDKTGRVLNCVNLKQTQTATCCLSIRHADKVGVLASILETLKSEGHNVQEMENIIFDGGHAACARIFLVGTPSERLIDSLSVTDTIFSCSISPIRY